jgi:hypothetical protein
MGTVDLLALACTTLAEPAVSPALKRAAAEALLAAIDDGLAVPVRAVRLVWSYWTACPASRSWRSANRLGDVVCEEVRADALAILEGGATGMDLRDLAVDVLVGRGHAPFIEERSILAIVEHVQTGEHASEVARLIGAVHAARGVSAPLLCAVRDRWARSGLGGVREAAIVVAAEIAAPDLAFIAAMLADPDVEVRTALAYRLATGFPGSEVAGGLIAERLRIEPHPSARAALLRAQASMIEDHLLGDGGVARS